MLQFIDNLASSNRSAFRRFQLLRRIIVRYYDPLVKFSLNGTSLVLPWSHNLPMYRRLHPTYSDNLARLAVFLRREHGHLYMIDVGANIGDSYHLVHAQSDDAYLLIEGDPTYFALLVRNTPTDPSVIRVQALVSDSETIQSAHLVSTGGTGKIVKNGSSEGKTVTYKTIDNIVQGYPIFYSTNLLKTDIDGFDSKALLGSLDLLQKAQPVLFFEHHPQLLAAADMDSTSIFSVLQQMGYSQAIFYDNLGFLLCTASMDNKQLLESLVFYAQQKSGYYYDICCFPDTQQRLAKKFLTEEHAFYSTRMTSHF